MHMQLGVNVYEALFYYFQKYYSVIWLSYMAETSLTVTWNNKIWLRALSDITLGF